VGAWIVLVVVSADPGLALTADICDIDTGLVRQVIARGQAEIHPFDVPRGQRMLSRYLGPDVGRWDSRFRRYLHADPAARGTIWIRLKPASLSARDLSYRIGE
jgi:hypothetical protein